ncbi:hypothetical protein IMX26_10560 [Clostridium sp. 'deep sea']|uniref:hypothetical protein n=1 Tax=Clostridium sp. 'deep sea' TaxID=2779445 RepID=UPI0018969CBB|nr:hypothetical protein [Clostridium sp. 'deep sea']QOR33933.1 hypothetical protein IMX26_10560 [Clostridium sp. 'deep sea']
MIKQIIIDDVLHNFKAEGLHFNFDGVNAEININQNFEDIDFNAVELFKSSNKIVFKFTETEIITVTNITDAKLMIDDSSSGAKGTLTITGDIIR